MVIEDQADALRGRRVSRLVEKGRKPATTPVTVRILRVLDGLLPRADRPVA